jgi:NAD(P)-dependent dehydrogenase (short-subunit alcohol dehydrogenase family)
MSNNIEGKIVVITGASSGLGEATSQPNRHASVARRSAALIKTIAEGTSLEGQRPPPVSSIASSMVADKSCECHSAKWSKTRDPHACCRC